MVAPHLAARAAQESAHLNSTALNPEAQSFDFPPDSDHAESGAVVRRDSLEDQEQIQDLAQQLQSMAAAYGEEILSLRKDVENLKQGGLTVKFVAGRLPSDLDATAIEATKERIRNTNTFFGERKIHDGQVPKAIEAAPAENEGSDSDTQVGSPDSTVRKDYGSPATPSVGLSLSRHAPKEPVTPTSPSQTNGNQSAASKNNGPVNGAPTTTKRDTDPVIVRSSFTQTTPTGKSVAPQSTVQSNGNSGKKVNDAPSNVSKVNETPAKKQESSFEVDANTPLPTTEDPFTVFIKNNPTWKPLGVRRLAPVPPKLLKSVPTRSDTTTFSWDFIRDLFGGKQWSPGFYYKEAKAGHSILPSRSYYALDASMDPYLPKTPGAHGAKLTAFFNPENPEDIDGTDGASAFERVPLFIAVDRGSAADGTKKPKRYVYFGMYSQPRYSDKLDFDHMMEAVPHSVKMHWATTLADPSRPQWVTAMLKSHFGDSEKPEYDGPMPDGTANGCDPTEFKNEVFEYVKQLKAWSKMATKAVQKLTKEDVLEAFEREDTACPPGMRLWWEYLACDDYDYGFYGMLVHEQEKFELRRKGDPKFKQHSVDRSALNMMEQFD
ncbi:hypothetical protein HDK77DRAFT_44004 [Phyllosticta capitalensis]